MSTPYNNQWVLGRLRARWRRRAHAAAGGALAEPSAALPTHGLPGHALPEQPREQPPSSKSHAKHAPRSPTHAARERPRPASGRAARRHPRWVDRDT